MMSLAPCSKKLGKLIPRLSTNSDGEIVATVRAIRSTLERHGCDLHDLAEAIGEFRDMGSPGAGAHFQPVPEVLNFCLSAIADLEHHERRFILTLARIFAQQGAIELSPKQWSWLLSIASSITDWVDHG